MNRFPSAVRAALSLCAVVVGSVLFTADAKAAEEKNKAVVSFLEGSATNSTGGTGEAQPLKQDQTVVENDVVATTAGSKLELKLKDGSVIRVGPSSKLQLKSAYFGDNGEKKFSAKLLFGRVWSKVSGLVSNDSKFEVETDNAVAGVRGTTFRVDASNDKSVLVRVYAGAVAMAAPGLVTPAHKTGKAERKRVNGPKEITGAQWEKLVGASMQMRVAADGTPGDPTPFASADDTGDSWAQWNQERDGQ